MNHLFEKLTQVESELAQLRITAKRLAETVDRLKTEAEPAATAAARAIIPPPIPQITAPITAPTPEILSIPEIPIPHEQPSNEQPSIVLTRQNDPVLESEDPLDKTGGLEMHLGRVWSVRLGIVLLTTGFVFLSSYTYETFVREFGPGLRLTMMYLFSFLLTGVGLFCERWKESLKTYGRIVAAGGLAAIYYCGFAAHNIEGLKVIDSPVAASILLFVSAGLFCAVSLWRESRVMLSTSLALAFYSISVNPIGWMSCLSALVLGSFGIAMMIRYRWIEIGFLVLGGSYFSYLLWQVGVNAGAGSISHWFLPAYWLLFATASLIPRKEMPTDQHVIFTTFNNAAFFTLFSFRISTVQWMEQHWLFCLIFGAALISLFFIGKERFPEKSRLIHLAKGISIITLGLVLLLDGHQLFVALLLEALALMALTVKFPQPLNKVASWIVALLSFGALTTVDPSQIHPALWLFGVIGWVALGTLHRWTDRKTDELHLHLGGLAASLLALIILTFGLMSDWSEWQRGLTLGALGTLASALALTRRTQLHALDSLLIFLGGGFIALGSVLPISPPNIILPLLGAILALSSSVPLAILCLKDTNKERQDGLHLFTGVFLALSLGLIWLTLDKSQLAPIGKLLVVLTIPILGTLVAGKTKLLAHSMVPFFMHAAVLAIFGMSTLPLFVGFIITAGHFYLVHKTHHFADRDFLKGSLFLIAAAFWGCTLLSGFNSPGVPLALTAITLFITAPFFGKPLASSVAIPYFLGGLAMSVARGASVEVYLCLLALFILHLFLTFHRADKNLAILTTIALLVFWLQITIDTRPLPLAAIWALLGTILLLGGLGLKSRCFRLIGVIILACSLGHLMIIDIIKLDPLPRILSFMTLGLGLLGLGFVYNRWQDRLKQML